MLLQRVRIFKCWTGKMISVMQPADLYAQDATQSDVRLRVHNMTCGITFKRNPFIISGQGYVQARSYAYSHMTANFSLQSCPYTMSEPASNLPCIKYVNCSLSSLPLKLQLLNLICSHCHPHDILRQTQSQISSMLLNSFHPHSAAGCMQPRHFSPL